MGNFVNELNELFFLVIDKKGYVNCSNGRHIGGLFTVDELMYIKSCVEKMIDLYAEEGITDDYILNIDKEAEERMKAEWESSRKKSKEKEVQKDDLYLVCDRTANLLKIGRSKNPKERLKQLQAANGHELEMICIVKDCGFQEVNLHQKFKDLRQSGEWFLYSEEIINAYKKLGGVILLVDKKKELFEECWKAYRRKGSKKLAFEQWCKLKDDEKESVMPHIKVYVQAREYVYQKDFERYLRDRIFNTIVISGNNLLYDPTKGSEYTPQTGGSLFWSEQYNCYMYIGFWNDYIPDGYKDEERPDGATVMLNNARGSVRWSKESKKWNKI